MSEKKEVKTLAEKLRQVMLVAGSVEKRGYNSHQNYRYVMESDVSDAVRNAFVEQGVIWIPSIETMEHNPIEVSQRGEKRTAYMARILMRVTLLNSEDTSDKLELLTAGIGLDSGDKALNKAITAAQKYALMKLFLMGTDDDSENPKHDASSEGHVAAPAQRAPHSEAPRGSQPQTAEEWEAYWKQYPYEYAIPYKEGQAVSIKEALKEAKAMFRGGKNRDKSDNGDTGANKHWYTKTRIPGFEQYLVSGGAEVPPPAQAPQKELSFADDEIPW